MKDCCNAICVKIHLIRCNQLRWIKLLIIMLKSFVSNSRILLCWFLILGAGTYTTSSLSTKTTTTSDPPNICKVKPQQLQTSNLASAGHFSQLSCMPSLIAQQQQSPQVYVSQSAAGNVTNLFIKFTFISSVGLFSGMHPFSQSFKLNLVYKRILEFLWKLD